MLYPDLPPEHRLFYERSLTESANGLVELQNTYGRMAIQNIFMMNGGGAVAILSFKAAYFATRGDLNWANNVLYLFLAGLLVVVLLNFFEYFRFFIRGLLMRRMARDFFAGGVDHAVLNFEIQRRDWTVFVSIGLGILSVVLFLLGILAMVNISINFKV